MPYSRNPDSRRCTPIALAALIAAAAWAAGCKFEPKFTSGTIPCDAKHPCPPGLSCVPGLQLCYAAGTVPDGATGVGGGAAGDAGTGGRDGAADQTLSADRPADLGGDARADLAPSDAGDGGCAAGCTLGDKRCGTFGLQTCVLVGGCPNWSPDVLCNGRQTCQGSAPGARCACPPPPEGCAGGKGSVCVGSVPATARACDVDAEGCIFVSTETTCTSGKPCTGSFPSGVCTCPVAPAICGGHTGTFCESPTLIRTCGNDSDGCLALTRSTSCDPAKPCAVANGTATCSCTSAPAECGGATGGACRPNNVLASCDLDNNGCLAVLSFGPCDSGLTCQGTAPNASCQCPAAPEVCRGTTGTFCQGASVVTCRRDSHGCLGIAATDTCPGVQTCAGNPGTARCACPAPPAQCPGGVGRLCDASGNLVNCVADANQCLSVASSAPCQQGLVCRGQFPSADCGCPAPPAACRGAASGNVCVSATSYVTCATSGQGCVVVTSTSGTCPGGTKPCSGDPGHADCNCTTSAPSECIVNGTFLSGGSVCANANRVTRCSTDGNGCQSGTTTTCQGAQTCQGMPPNAGCACSGAPDCNPAVGAGTHCVGSTLVTCTAAGQGCFTEITAPCNPPQACVGPNPTARCASEVSYGVPKPQGTVPESWVEQLIAVRINITEATTLRRFGLIWAGNGATPPAAFATRVIFGLYPDGIGAAGTPAPLGRPLAGALVAVSDPGAVEVVPQRPVNGDHLVPAGTYWLLVNIEAVNTLPLPIKGAPSVARLAQPETPALALDWPFASDLPLEITADMKFTDHPFKGPLNLYLIGMPLQ